MEHDDDIRKPETTPITTGDLRRTTERPPENIYRLIVSENRDGRRPGAIQEALLENHHLEVPLKWVMFVLNEVEQAAKRRTR